MPGRWGRKIWMQKSIAITFDDGFYSTTKFAQPVLKRYGFTGSVFVIGSAIDEQHGPYDPKLRQHASHADMQDERVLRSISHIPMIFIIRMRMAFASIS